MKYDAECAGELARLRDRIQKLEALVAWSVTSEGGVLPEDEALAQECRLRWEYANGVRYREFLRAQSSHQLGSKP